MAAKSFPCKEHKQNCQMYCVTCDCVVCTNCVTTSHRKHEFSDFAEMVSRKRLEFNLLKTQFMDVKLPKVLQITKDVRKKEEIYDRQEADVWTKVDQQGSNLTQMIGIVKNKYKETLRNEKALELKPWKNLEQEVEKQVDEAKRKLVEFDEALSADEVRTLPDQLRDLKVCIDIQANLAIPITAPRKPDFERYKIDEKMVENIMGRLCKISVPNESRSDSIPFVRPRKLPPPKCDISVIKCLDMTGKFHKFDEIAFIANMDEKSIVISISKQLVQAEKFKQEQTIIQESRSKIVPLCRYSHDSLLVCDEDRQNLYQLSTNGKRKLLYTNMSGTITAAYVNKLHQLFIAMFYDEDVFGEILRLDKNFEVKF